jgi:hypothetical protein
MTRRRAICDLGRNGPIQSGTHTRISVFVANMGVCIIKTAAATPSGASRSCLKRSQICKFSASPNVNGFRILSLSLCTIRFLLLQKGNEVTRLCLAEIRSQRCHCGAHFELFVSAPFCRRWMCVVPGEEIWLVNAGLNTS